MIKCTRCGKDTNPAKLAQIWNSSAKRHFENLCAVCIGEAVERCSARVLKRRSFSPEEVLIVLMAWCAGVSTRGWVIYENPLGGLTAELEDGTSRWHFSNEELTANGLLNN